MEKTTVDYIKDPMGIERRSFEIIGEEMAPHGFDEKTLAVVKRVIHTTADFEYADLIEFSESAIESGMKALAEGSDIYADTNMVMAGINKRKLGGFGGKIYNFVHEEAVFTEAKERGVTRSMVSIEKVAKKKTLKYMRSEMHRLHYLC